MIGQIRQQLQEELQDTLPHGILALLDEAQLRYGAAQAARQAVCQRLQEYQAKIESLESNTTDRLRQQEAKLMDKEPVQDAAAFIRDYAQLQLQLFTLSGVIRQFSALTPILEKTDALGIPSTIVLRISSRISLAILQACFCFSNSSSGTAILVHKLH